MGKIAEKVDKFLDNYDEIIAQFESGTIKPKEMPNKLKEIKKQTEKEIIELIEKDLYLALYSRDDIVDTDLRNKIIDKVIAKLKGN